MVVKVKKWGNGYGVLLPKLVMQKLRLREDEELSFSFHNDQLIFEKASTKEYTLEDIIKKATVKKSHPETDWGTPVGGEVW